jgi:hypothetical protein
MEDEIDIARRAVGQVMWEYCHILKSSAAGEEPWNPLRGYPEIQDANFRESAVTLL